MFCVIWRQGGTANFTWHRTLGLVLRETADQTAEAVRRAGYPAFVENYERSLAIGLPEGYEYESMPGDEPVGHPYPMPWDPAR